MKLVSAVGVAVPRTLLTVAATALLVPTFAGKEITPSGLSTITSGTTHRDSVARISSLVQSKHATATDRGGREKREGGRVWNATSRVRTGETVLNIKGAIRDSIGDGPGGGSGGDVSLVDTVVIHPSQHRHTPHQHLETLPRQETDQRPRNIDNGVQKVLVEPGSRVKLECDLPNVTSSQVEWYKDGEVMPLGDGPGSGAVWRGEGGTAVVERMGRGEAGAWRCAGNARRGRKIFGVPQHLVLYEEVRGPYLRLDGRRLDAGNTWVPVREKTVLDVLCVAEGGVPAPELRWRLVSSPETEDSNLETRLYLRQFPTNYSREGIVSSLARVTAAREMHNASLECEASQPRPTSLAERSSLSPPPLARLQLHVTYPPSFVISRWPGFGIALHAGVAAALRCDVDSNPPARAWWMRDGHEPASSPPPVDGAGGEEESGGAKHSSTLRWSSLSAAHAGWYRCRARYQDGDYSSIGYYLNIYPGGEEQESGEAEEPLEEQEVEVPFGGSVQINCPKGTVGCWSRRVPSNGTEVSTESWVPAGSHRAHGVLSIKDALYQESGEYRCVGLKASHQVRLQELKRVSLRVVGGAQATPLSPSDVNSEGWREMRCLACGRGVRLRWLLPGGIWLSPGEAAAGEARAGTLRPEGGQSSCWISRLELRSEGEVWCAVAGEGEGAGGLAVFPALPTPAGPPHPPPRALHTAAAAPAPARSADFASLVPALTFLLAYGGAGGGVT